MGFLATSIVLSVVATVLLNVVPRLFPRQTQSIGQRIDERVSDMTERSTDGRPGETGHDRSGGPSVRVFFPWKAMLIGSVVLTVLLNVAPRLF